MAFAHELAVKMSCSLSYLAFFIREQLNKSSKSMANVCLMDHTQRITDLLAQINTFQVSRANT